MLQYVDVYASVSYGENSNIFMDCIHRIEANNLI